MKYNIRALLESDLAFLIEVRNECRSYLHDDREFSLDDVREWFFSKKPSFFIAEIDGKAVGYFRTSEWDFKNGHVMIGMDIHKDFRGRGLAKKFYVLFIDYLFNTFNFHKLKLQVLSTNTRAIQLYHDLGFKVEGVLVEDVKHGDEYIDSIIMSLFRRDWLCLKKK